MKETQPPITNAEEYGGYQRALEDINAECFGREQDVFHAQNDPARLDRARHSSVCIAFAKGSLML